VAEETAPSRPRIDRYYVAADIFIFICSTSAACLTILGNRLHTWEIVSLIFQIILAGTSAYRLARAFMKWNRATDDA